MTFLKSSVGSSSPRLDHLNIVVGDLAASIAFYQALFDLAVTLDCRLHGPWFEAVTGMPGAVADCVILSGGEGGLRIELLRYLEPPGVAWPGNRHVATQGLRHFAVRVDDISACLARARDVGYGLSVVPVEVPREILPSGKKMAYIHDPDGVIVELAEYGNL